MSETVNRRNFLKGAAAGAAALSLSAASYARVFKANERIVVNGLQRVRPGSVVPAFTVMPA